jgi:hypothetical protein
MTYNESFCAKLVRLWQEDGQGEQGEQSEFHRQRVSERHCGVFEYMWVVSVVVLLSVGGKVAHCAVHLGCHALSLRP